MPNPNPDAYCKAASLKYPQCESCKRNFFAAYRHLNLANATYLPAFSHDEHIEAAYNNCLFYKEKTKKRGEA